uniref:MFS domain-containing protein n=1 Tax=Parastrongyloides trichosuri TaxID=131310 RepID=A0A0N4ZQA4_PARTI
MYFCKIIASVFNNDVAEDETNWLSIYIASILSFSASVQCSLYFSSMWPFLTVLEPGISSTFFGVAIASYSLGNILLSPLFGYWSNKIGTIKTPVNFGLYAQLIGNLIYMNLELFPYGARYGLVAARLFTGVGSANVTLFKSYGASGSSSKDRSIAIAYVTSGIAIGIAIGPAFNLLFTPMGYPGIIILGMRVNMYTLPAIGGVITNIVSIIVMKFLFIEHYAGVINKEGKDSENYQKIPKYDKISVLVIYATRFCQYFVFTNLEALNSPISLMIFGWSKKESITILSIAQGILGFAAFGVYFMYIIFKLDRYINYRLNCIGGIVALLIFHIITFSYPFLPSVITYHSSNITNTNETEIIGCDIDMYSWCEYINRMNPIVYLIAFALIIGIAFPTINIAMNTLFSKILGPRRQGTQQGFMQMCGGCGQLIGPLITSAIYTNFGPRYVWSVEIIFIFFTVSLWLIFFNRMVPLKYEANNNIEVISKKDDCTIKYK